MQRQSLSVQVISSRSKQGASGRRKGSAEELDPLEARNESHVDSIRYGNQNQADSYLEFVLQAVGGGFWQWEIGTGANQWSPQTWALYGLEPNSVIPCWDSWIATVLPSDRERVSELVVRAVSEGQGFEVEWTVAFACPGTKNRRLSSRGRPVRDTAGGITRYVGVVLDVTQPSVDEFESRLFEESVKWSDIPFFVIDASDCRILKVNASFIKLVKVEEVSLLGSKLSELVPTDHRLKLNEFFRTIGKSKRGTLELEISSGDGTRIPVRLVSNLVTSDWGQAVQVAHIIDLTTIRTLEGSLSSTRKILDLSDDFLVTLDSIGRVLSANQTLLKAIGYKPNEIVGLDPSTLLGTPAALEVMDWSGETIVRRRSGDTFPSSFRLSPILDQRGQSTGWILTGRDISLHLALQSEVMRRATTDSVTGLPNRSSLMDRLATIGTDSGQRFILAIVNLDNFSDLNESFGHSMGDSILAQMTTGVRKLLSPDDFFARLAGDEFVILRRNYDGSRSFQTKELLELIASGQVLRNGTGRSLITASIGAALFPDDAKYPEELLSFADYAMQNAKQGGKGSVSFFTGEMLSAVHLRRSILSALPQAVQTGRLSLVYQPIICLSSGNLAKYEALLRWNDPQLGAVSPDVFVPIAESTGLINSLGDWVFDQACEFLCRHHQRNACQAKITINVSPAQFQHAGLSDRWIEVVRSKGLSPKQITVEITEGVMMKNNPQVMAQVQELRASGITIALDDFGTGYSSLSYLDRFPVDFIKIDKSFLRTIESSERQQSLCRAIVAVAHALGAEVIAEGVETECQVNLLKSIACDYAQGYYFSRPLPEIEASFRVTPSGDCL